MQALRAGMLTLCCLGVHALCSDSTALILESIAFYSRTAMVLLRGMRAAPAVAVRGWLAAVLLWALIMQKQACSISQAVLASISLHIRRLQSGASALE
jgi:hypothetical protein